MTDKEIAKLLRNARWWPITFKGFSIYPETAYIQARGSVHIIHHIINSINWED